MAPGLIVTLRRGFARFDPDASDAPDARTHYLHRPETEPATNRFNDPMCDAQGRFWGGTMDSACRAATGALYRFDSDGRCVRHGLGFAVTNGPTWSLDQRTMYVDDTVNGRVHAFDFDAASDHLSAQRLWLQFGPGDGVPDGMTTDPAGRLRIARSIASSFRKRIGRFTPNGSPLATIARISRWQLAVSPDEVSTMPSPPARDTAEASGLRAIQPIGTCRIG